MWSPFSLSSFQENILQSLGRPYRLTQDLPKQGISLCDRISSGREKKCIQLEPRMDSNWLAKTNESQRKLQRLLSILSLALISFRLALFCTLWLHFSSRPAGHFPFSRMNIHKHHSHTKHSELVCETPSLAHFCTDLIQLYRGTNLST